MWNEAIPRAVKTSSSRLFDERLSVSNRPSNFSNTAASFVAPARLAKSAVSRSAVSSCSKLALMLDARDQVYRHADLPRFGRLYFYSVAAETFWWNQKPSSRACGDV